jgi:two-component system, NtrC family, sensor kinase
MHCPRCQHESAPTMKFCGECGTPLKAVDPSSPPAPSYAEITSALSEALEQQTATAEILRVISSSPTDVQPVFDAIAESSVRLCDADFSLVHRFDGELIHLAAHRRLPPEIVTIYQRMYPRHPSRESLTARAILDRTVIHVVDAQEDLDIPEASRTFARLSESRSGLVVPMLREGRPVGCITVARAEARSFTESQISLLKTFANQAVIAIENVRLFNETKEALEQQTATGEILRVIARSPTDFQPVMAAVAENAARLCGANDAMILRVENNMLHPAAVFGRMPSVSIPLSRRSPGGRTVIDRQTFHIHDIAAVAAEYPDSPAAARGVRTFLSTPLLSQGDSIGAIVIRRMEVKPFTDQQIALLQTFADQAVIAIENVRLFQELQEKNRALSAAHAQVSGALERQTATANILSVISSSPTDVQPVFNAIVESATRLCGARVGHLFRFDGELLHLVARHNSTPDYDELLRRLYPMRPSRGQVSGRVILSRAVVQIPDVLSDPEYRPDLAIATDWRSRLGVPLLREGNPIGVIVINRTEPGLFADSHIELLRTFADQAVIAIENVRLFNETKEALEQQTATSDILRVISSSPTDVQPVFDAIVRSAVELCNGLFGLVIRFDGERLHLVAHHNWTAPALDAFSRVFPRRLDRSTFSGRAILDGAAVHVPDIEQDTEIWSANLEAADTLGYRSVLVVPMLRKGLSIGTIAVARESAGRFSDEQIALLKTFAEQAVIAIENVRLFQELRARTAELTRSVEELKALGEVGQTVSSTLDLETVLTTIAARADQLSGTDGAAIYEFDEASGTFHLRVALKLEQELLGVLRARPTPLGEGVVGRVGLAREPVQIPDIVQDEAYRGPLREVALRAGNRALLAVPLLREDLLVGALVVRRRAPGRFPEETVKLLQTFATQSVLAIQNARLFREIADKSRQLEAASRHKSEFLANMSHELRTPLNAILGFSEVLAERMFGEVNEKQAEYLQDILSSGRHLLSLINDILDLSKVEAGRVELELGRFHLPTTLDNALTLVRERATRHGITLTQTVDERLGDFVADERKVKQILVNLLSNAVKFTPEGGRVGVAATAADGAISIAVSDTGIGIAPEDQATIFEEFRQVGREDARKQEGTGLGLTLAKKFVELHGGRIWVESQVGQGSTFTFTLPVRPDGGSASDQGGGEPPRP